MRVDHAAAARANMRSRTRDNHGKLQISKEEIAKRQELQKRLGFVLSGCMTCCKAHWLEGDGSTLGCALLNGAVDPTEPLTELEQEVAAQCPIPGLYSEVFAGKLEGLTRLQVLEKVPFDVPEDVLEGARYEAEGLPEAAAETPAPIPPAPKPPKAPKPDKQE